MRLISDEYRKRLTAVEAVEATLRADPVHWVLARLPREQQRELARALAVIYTDDPAPTIAAMEDPEYRTEALEAMKARVLAIPPHDPVAAQRAQQCLDAAAALIPDDVPDEVAARFMQDAVNDLSAIARTGWPLTPESVPDLLRWRAERYGFPPPAGGGTTSIES